MIPKEFQGVVVVLFDETDGTKPEYEGDARIYKIPQDGILKTQFTAPKVTGSYSFFYRDSNGKMNPMTYYSPVDLADIRESESTIICFNIQKAVNTGEDSNNKVRRFEVLIVSSLKNLDSIGNLRSRVTWQVLGNK